jgi:hypothetical protein
VIDATSLILLFLLPASVAAAELSELKEFPKDLWGGFKEEVRIDRPEGLLTLLAGGGGASIARFGSRTYFDDFKLADTLRRRRPLGQRAVDLGSTIGYSAYLLPTLAGAYFTGAYFDADSTQEFGLLGFEAVTLAGIQTQLLKFSVSRLRPDETDRAAFPSGHTAASFALASVAASKWGWPVALPAYALASFVGFTRLENQSHYLSDIVFGAGLGIASGRAVYHYRRKAHPDRYVFAPFISPGGGGVTVSF